MLKRYRRELALLLGAAAIVLVVAADVLAQPRRPRRPVQPAYGWVSGTIRLDTSGAGVPGPRGGSITIWAVRITPGRPGTFPREVFLGYGVALPVRAGQTSWHYQGLRVPIRTQVYLRGRYLGDWRGGTGAQVYPVNSRPVFLSSSGQSAVGNLRLRGSWLR